MDDFEWVKDVMASIILKPGRVYYVECGNHFDEVVIRNTFNKIFGIEKVNHSYEHRLNEYINLFNNNYLNNAIVDGSNVTFSFSYGDEFIKTAWTKGDYYRDNYPDGEFISMDDFINYCAI